jgi:RNA polymerase sigma factor (TIGR02999 family)
LRREDHAHTLQATALVNELYLRLSKVEAVKLNDRQHFFTFAARLMRLILIDHARARRAQKRPDAAGRVPLHEEMAWVDAANEGILDLDAALDELEQFDERKVRAVELRYFLGCTNEEAAELLSVSRPTVDRDLEFAKAWLYRRLAGLPGAAAGTPA